MFPYIIFIAYSVVLYFIAPTEMDRGFMALGIVPTIGFCIHFFRTNIDNNCLGFFRHSNIFVLIYLVVFYQCYIDYLLGFIDNTEIRIWINTSIVPRALCLCNIGLSSFLIGYKYQEKIGDSATHNYVVPSVKKYPAKSLLCLLGYFMFAVFLFSADASFFRSGYLISEGNLDTSFGILVLLQSVLIATFTLYSLEYRNSKIRGHFFKFFRSPIILVVLYSGVVVLSGRRTEALRAVIMLLFVYLYASGNRMSVKKTLLYLCFLVVSVSVFGVIRGEGASITDGIKELIEVNTISPFTRELAGSVKTVHIAMDYIPKNIPYNYGITFFASLSLLVPGLDRLIRYAFPSGLELNSATLISNLYWGGDDWGYGLGSSIVADVYVSFGVIGVLIILFLLGKLFRVIEILTTRTTNVYWIALSMGVYSQILYSCRTGVSVLFLSWTYACILLYLTSQIFKNKNQRKNEFD